MILTGSANPVLGADIAKRLGTALVARVLDRFPDGELHVELRESVRGKRVFLIQPTSAPVEQHLFELLLLADACRRAGARERMAVIPYFGYARQDRRAVGRDPIGARVVADKRGGQVGCEDSGPDTRSGRLQLVNLVHAEVAKAVVDHALEIGRT